MLVISINSACTVIRDQASPKITHPHSTKRRSEYTLKLKKKKSQESLRDHEQRSRNASIVVEAYRKRNDHHIKALVLTHYLTIPHVDTLKIYNCRKHCEKRRNYL